MHNYLKELQRGFEKNTKTIKKYAEGVNKEESLFRPYEKVNAMVWNLGHISFVRNTIIKLLDAAAKLELYENERNLFVPGAGLPENEAYPSLDVILEHFAKRGERISQILETVSDEQLQKDSFVQFNPAIKSNENYVFYFYNHEIEHLGEIKMLKNLITRLR